MINWLASYPKSGNTWLRMLLTAYISGRVDINHAGVTTSDTKSYFWKALCPSHMSELTPEQMVYLRPAVLMHMIEGAIYRPVIMKTHWANVMVGGITAIPRPLSRPSVYIIRDPRDVCPSYAKHMGCTIDEAILGMGNDFNVLLRKDSSGASWLKSWSSHVESWERDFVKIIRYEDLKENTEEVFSQVLNQYGMKVEKKKVRAAVKKCDIDKFKAQEAKEKFIERGNQEKFFGQGRGWKNELTEKQARRIVEDHKEVMEKYGYI